MQNDDFLNYFQKQCHIYLQIHVTEIPRAPVAQLVEHRAVTREVVSSTPAGPTLKAIK